MRPGITTVPCRSTTSASAAMRVISASGPMAIIRPSLTARAVSSRSSRIGSAMVIIPEALRNTASRLKLYWYADTIGAVHVEYLDGYPVHGRETDDTLSLDTKVMIPGIGAEIEEACQLTAFGAHTREIARPVVAWS